MTSTIWILIGGLAFLLVGVGLLSTLLGVRATLESFSSAEYGLIVAGYYGGYILGTLVAPGLIRRVGHIRVFSAFAAGACATTLLFGLIIHPLAWLLLRVLSGLCVVGLYMVVESWLNEQSTGPVRGRVFSVYMMSTLGALAVGQYLLLAGDTSQLPLFAIAAIFISLGVVPIAVNRVTEPRIVLSNPVGLRQLMQISPLGTVGTLVAGVVTGSFWGLVPVYGQQIGLAENQLATVMSLIIIGGAFLQWPIGHISDLIDRRKALLLIAATTALCTLLVTMNTASQSLAMLLLGLVFGGLMFSLYGLCVAHTNDHLEQDQILEATRGLLLIYGVGALLGPLLSGSSMEWFGPAGLPGLMTVSLLLLVAYGGYRMTRRAAPPAEEQSDFVPMVRTTPLALDMMPEADPEQLRED